jgi:hypothetical protein
MFWSTPLLLNLLLLLNLRPRWRPYSQKLNRTPLEAAPELLAELEAALARAKSEAEALEGQLLEGLGSRPQATLEVLAGDGTKRTRLLTRENAAALAAWVRDFAAWRVLAPDDPHLPRFERIANPPRGVIDLESWLEESEGPEEL